MGDYKKPRDRDENRISEQALESAAGGCSSVRTIRMERITPLGYPVHGGCGSNLIFLQESGTYYCPRCRREVADNEVLK